VQAGTWGSHLPQFVLRLNCLEPIRAIQSQAMVDRFRDRLLREFDERRKVNARYSLRAFAGYLGADHSTLSQILRSQRPLPLNRIRSWAKKLGLDSEVAAAYVAAEHLPDPQSAARENQILQWTSEASAIITEPVHWHISRLSRTSGFRSDSRWIAEQAGTTVDEVNLAFVRLLRLELLRTDAAGRWIANLRRDVRSEREFQRTALTRVRKKAAESNVMLPATLLLK
jgi:transcriptional regulator with XRE-family HTH domain